MSMSEGVTPYGYCSFSSYTLSHALGAPPRLNNVLNRANKVLASTHLLVSISPIWDSQAWKGSSTEEPARQANTVGRS